MAELTLYTNPQSRGRTARWMLEEVGQPYEAVILPYGPPMQTSEYRALNPMCKVPTLVHGEQVVTECAAVCAYLAEAFPEAELAPRPEERGAYFRWLFFGAGPLEAAMTNRALQVEVPPEKQGFVGYGSWERVLDALEHAVSRTPFLAGPRFTAADVYVGATIGWGMYFESIPRRPALESYWSRIADRPARKRANELDETAIKAASADAAAS